MSTQQQILSELDEIQLSLDRWYQRTTSELAAAHSKFSGQLKLVEDVLSGRAPPQALPAAVPTNGGAVPRAAQQKPQGMDWETLLTPPVTPMREATEQRTPSLASPPVSHPLNYESLLDDMNSGGASRTYSAAHNASTASEHDMRQRPTPDALQRSNPHNYHPQGAAGGGETSKLPCQVLVEFKRKRILQFESPYYVAPGEYVVVGGDRGEDIGLVTHSWPQGQKGEVPGQGRWNGGVGMGKVLRIANVLEVSQLQGVQTQLEGRAVDVAQEKVREHQLPMKIVDAEYQFDRKKLTFYYQSQHRLDFRNLVRDLYKTFRARIWMELDGA